MKEVSVINFYKIYQSELNVRLIDVRDLSEYDEYHIHGSVNVPLNLLLEKHNLFINKKYHYYVICKNGTRSKTAFGVLTKLGYNVTNIIDGIERWPGLFVRTKRYKF
jgi:rhodanese-related sulfurtransferase